MPVVVPEAMAAGLPLIGSNVGGIPVLVKDGQNGILVKERDAERLAEAVIKLMQNPDIRKEFGLRSRRIIENSVNYDHVSEYISALYREIAVKKTISPEIPPFEIKM